MPTLRHHFKRCAISFGIVIGIYLVVAITLTTTVDPWRVLRMPWALDSLEEYRDFSDDHRTGKAGLAMDPKGWDIAYVGSSRVENGLTTEYSEFGSSRVVNLGLAAGLIPENTAMAKFVIRKNPELGTLLLGIDTGDLTGWTDRMAESDFSRSPLAEDQSAVERKLRYLIGVRAMGESVKVISNRYRGMKSKYSPGGQRTGKLGTLPPVRDLIEARKDFYRSQARAFDTPNESALNSQKLVMLEEVLTDARRADIRVILALMPRHALMQIHPSRNDPEQAPWERERLELAKLCKRINDMHLQGPKIQFLDFCTFSPLNTQPLPNPSSGNSPFPEWPDLEHCSGKIGVSLLERCFVGDENLPAQWGVNVLETGVQEYLDLLRRGHLRYCEEHPADVQWLRSTLFPEKTD